MEERPIRPSHVKLWMVVTAAGSSRRMGGGNKLLLALGGRPVLAQTLTRLSRCAGLSGLVLTAPAGDEGCYSELLANSGLECATWVVTGGAERQDSIGKALDILPASAEDAVGIHDGARPNVTPELLDRLLAALETWQGALPMVGVKDTIKRVSSAGLVVETLDRAELFAAQTPQVFRFGTILEAHRRARAEGWTVTDDASMIERLGGTVGKVEGDYANLKLTTPEDLAVLEKFFPPEDPELS